MRMIVVTAASCVLFGMCLSAAPVQTKQPDSKAWIDLFPGKDLQGWKRVPLAPDTKLSDRTPWSVDGKNKILICDGKDTKEMLLYQKPFADGVFHVEWRFKKVPGKKIGYNGGVYFRSANNGKVWLQAQVAMLDKVPQVGDLFGDVLVEGKIERILEHGTGHKHVNPVGEWNTYDIICKGNQITAKLNGKVVTTMNNCPRLSGYFGLQAEYFFIEFKNIKWKSIK